MDLRQMEMFKTVAEMASFTKAGEKLHVSHSAISRQVKLLEDELEVLLFTRANRKVTLTEPGKALLGHVETIFDQVTKATQSVSQMSSRIPRHLTLGTATTMLHFFLPPVLGEFRRRYPAIDVHIKAGQGLLIIEDVRCGKVDLAIGSVPIPVPGRELLVRPLYREELVIVVGKHHPLTKKNVIGAAELTQFPLITFRSYSTTRQILDNLFHRLKIFPNTLLELENDEAILTCVSEGMGIAFLPLKRALQRKLHFLRLADAPIFRTVGLFTLPSRQMLPHLACFSNLCFEQALQSSASDRLP